MFLKNFLLSLIVFAAVFFSGCMDPNLIPRVNWEANSLQAIRHGAYLDRQRQDLERCESDQRMAREAEGRTLAREDFNNGLPQGARAPFHWEGRNSYFQEWSNLDNQNRTLRENNARREGENDYLRSRQCR